MDITLFVSPYDSGVRSKRMGAGPDALLERGVEALLARHGDVRLERVDSPLSFDTEVTTSFALYRQLAERVAEARTAGRFPVVLSGNCGASIAMGAAFGSRSSVIWFDAHGDFNTPETTRSGFLDGMALAVLTGDCWRSLGATIPGFEPMNPRAAAHVGGRDFDETESERMAQRGVIVLTSRDVHAAADRQAEIRTFTAGADVVWIHVDLDVIDPSEGVANFFAVPGGLLVDEVIAFIDAVARVVPVGGMVLASYAPEADADGRAGGAALKIIDATVASAKR